ncbi:MAG TPA: hypothetical protein VFO89_13375, partial [Thermoanaerobaculia bacterium]|nr:hypothetical protein [Thermoanaerobaculia bacterium]
GMLLIALALPLSASQFLELPFDQLAVESQYIVRGQILETWSAWDDAHEVIFTYATVRVSRYFGETTGPDLLVIREAGGTVDGYTQEAIGFPMIRRGEDVVLMLAPWENGAELRIHGYNQGKFLVKNRGGREVLVADSVRQGDERLGRNGDIPNVQTEAADDAPALGLDEFAAMVEDARAGKGSRLPNLERQ